MPDAPVQIRVENGRLQIDAPTGFDRASLLSAIDIPAAHVSDVEVTQSPGDAISGWRSGIGLPHLRMGAWHHDEVKDYVAVDTRLPGVVVTLHDEPYARIIASVDDPEGVARQIRQARDTSTAT